MVEEDVWPYCQRVRRLEYGLADDQEYRPPTGAAADSRFTRWSPAELAILLCHDAVQGRQTGQQLHWAAVHESQEASDGNAGRRKASKDKPALSRANIIREAVATQPDVSGVTHHCRRQTHPTESLTGSSPYPASGAETFSGILRSPSSYWLLHR